MDNDKAEEDLALDAHAKEQAQPTADQEKRLTAASGRGGIGQASDTIELIAESGGVRGQAGMLLLMTLVRNLETQLSETRKELKETRSKSETIQTLLSAEQRNTAVLRTHLNASNRLKLIQSALIAVGFLLCGTGLQYIVDAKHLGWSWAFMGVGAALAALGFFPFKNQEI
jgi:hypothetical protein